MRPPSSRGRRFGRRFARRFAALVLLPVMTLGLVGLVATRVLARRAEARYPMLGRHVLVEGARHHVLERGSGPPVVLIHGAFGGLADFQATVADELATTCRLILWDRPGHGYSDRQPLDDGAPVDPGVQADRLAALLDELALDEPPLLVGFSYGGAVALSLAVRHPQHARGVLMLNGPSHPWPDPLDLSYRMAAWPVVGPALVHALVGPLAALLGDASVERAFHPLAVPDEFSASPVPLAVRPASYAANAEDICSLKPFLRGQASRYAGLEVPVTMLVAEGDLVVSPTLHSEGLSAVLPDLRQVRIENAGHQVLYTHTDLVVGLVREMLAPATGEASSN